jgi:hypothetical protein
MIVPTLERPVLATPEGAFVPDAFLSLATSVQCFNFIGFDNIHWHRLLLYVCLDRVADFVFAYLVLAKPEYAFVPDMRLVREKLGPYLILDAKDYIDSGIDTPL